MYLFMLTIGYLYNNFIFAKNFYVGPASCGIVNYYTVSYSSSGINVSKSIDCSSECSDDFTISEGDIGATYQVSVAALGNILDTELISK